YSCSVPKVINESGRVTPRGQVTGGASYMMNISTASSLQIGETLWNGIENYQAADTIQYDALLKDINSSLIAYALDPAFAQGAQFYFRVGVVNRLELGYLRASKTNMFHANYQFLGFDKDPEVLAKKRWFGAVGLRYSSQSFNLPKKFAQVQAIFDYRYSRKDWIMPVVFSYSFGPEEQYGSVSFGAIFGRHYMNYSVLPENIFNDQGFQLRGVEKKNAYNSVGLFVNVKAGYRFIYIIPSLSVYYQNYGEYPMLDKSTVTYKGLTLVPGISLQLNTVRKKKD
ncbi:MAG: hypothetical protein LPK45_12535, partial [Bacteroidota bacterium]|nr:hypothetical protein [Bacteroidota bacterium]MDX5431932.1 hypothetical protein [Bacteroidota bacterium]MDX5470650.1 hypothetical protein [Bacteroidota bacterium]